MLDEPFSNSNETEPPEPGSDTDPPPEAPSTNPDLGFFICPTCHALDGIVVCVTCGGMGIIDREAMREFKKKETLQ